MRKNIITPFFVLLLSLSLIAISSCKGKKSDRELKNIDIAGALGKGRIIPLSEIAKDIRYVALATHDTALVGNINSVFYENGLIYIVHSSTAISVFDDTGKFIRTIDRSGRGPEEYVSLMPIYMLQIDPDNGNILLVSQDSKIYEYTPTGIFVRKIQVPVVDSCLNSMSHILKMKDNTYIASLSSKDMFCKYCAVVFDTLSNIKYMVAAPKVDYDEISDIIDQSGWVAIESSNFTKIGDQTRIIYSYPNEISTIDYNMKIDTAYTINYGPYKVTLANRKDMFSPSAKIVNWIGSLMESENFLFIWLNLRALAHDPIEKQYTDENGRQNTYFQTNSYALFNKKTGDLTLMNQPIRGKKGFKDDIEGGPEFWPKTVSTQEYLVAAHTAVAFMEFAENSDCSGKIKELAARLNENDNPVIALVKLK